MSVSWSYMTYFLFFSLYGSFWELISITTVLKFCNNILWCGSFFIHCPGHLDALSELKVMPPNTILVLFLFLHYSIFLFSFSGMPISQMLELTWFSKTLTFFFTFLSLYSTFCVLLRKFSSPDKGTELPEEKTFCPCTTQLSIFKCGKNHLTIMGQYIQR